MTSAPLEPCAQILDTQSPAHLPPAQSWGPDRQANKPGTEGRQSQRQGKPKERSPGPLQGQNNPPLSQPANTPEKPKPQAGLLFNSSSPNKIKIKQPHPHTPTSLNHRGIPCHQESPWDSPGRAMSLLHSLQWCFQGHRGTPLISPSCL